MKWDSEITTVWLTSGIKTVLLYITSPEITILLYWQLEGEYHAQKGSNVCLGSPIQILTISNFPWGATTLGCTGVTLADTGSDRWKCWQLKGSIICKEFIVIISSPGQYIYEACEIMVSSDVSVKPCNFGILATIAMSCPSNWFCVSLATRMFHLSWIKTVYFLHSENRATTDSWKCCSHRLFYWLNVKLLPADYFNP